MVLPKPELLVTQQNAHDEAIWSVSWAKSEEKHLGVLVTGSLDDTVKAWRWDGGHLDAHYIFEGHSLGVVSVDINETGTIAASNSLDSHIRLWNLNTGELLQSIDAGPVNAWTVAFSPDSQFIATCTQAGKIFLYSTDTGEKLSKELDSNGKFSTCLSIRKDGRQLAGGSIDGMIRLYDIETGAITTTLEGHAMPIRSLAFSNDGQYLITASDDCHIKLYHTATGELIRTLSGHGSWVLSVDFSCDNRHFASGSSDKTVKIWDIESKESVHTITTHKDQVWGVKYSPDSSQLVSVSEDRSIAIHRVA